MSELNPLAQRILIIIYSATKKHSSYIAEWSIADKLGVSRSEFSTSIPGTQYDKALESLEKAGLIEELQDLRSRWQLTQIGRLEAENAHLYDVLKSVRFNLVGYDNSLPQDIEAFEHNTRNAVQQIDEALGDRPKL